MLITVKGTYEDGKVTFDELPPVQGRWKVLITFIDDDTITQWANDINQRNESDKNSSPTGE